MNSFLTGSRIYGEPRVDSDVDLVVRVSEFEARLLWRLADGSTSGTRYDGAVAVRFGRMNLIICTTDDAYLAWRTGTLELKELANSQGTPVTRDQAVEKFQEMFRLFEVAVNGTPSGEYPDKSDQPEALSAEVPA